MLSSRMSVLRKAHLKQLPHPLQISRSSSSTNHQAAVVQADHMPQKSKLQKLREQGVLPFSAFLTDTFGRQHNYLRISVTERCNLRCTYCMPEAGVPLTPRSELLSDSEIVRVGKLFISQGVDKIRFTGGEPLIRKELTKIIGQLSETKKLKSIGITTNGILLPRYLPELVSNGVTHINISLDSLNPKLFEKISRRPSAAWFKVWKAIELAEISKLDELKLNVVVMKGINDEEICDFVELTKHRDIDVRFIEYMPFSGNKWDLAKMVPYQEMLSIIREKFPEFSKLEDSVNHTAKAYRVPGHVGKFGFITSMSDHFCKGCNRLRVTADGNLKVCLFGNAEVSLRDAIRNGATDEKLLSLIEGGVKRKHAKHAAVSGSENEDESRLTHVDREGKVKMVDVSGKKITTREATAVGYVALSEEAFNAVLDNKLKKGDVLTVSQVAGILGGKQTSSLIPLCHPISLSKLDVELALQAETKSIRITSTAKTNSSTGVEVEALTAVSVAALTVYDMCKAVDKGIVIREIKLLKKTGGKSDYLARSD